MKASEQPSLREGAEPKRFLRVRRWTFLALLAVCVMATQIGLIYYRVFFSSPVTNSRPTVEAGWIDGSFVVTKVLSPAVAEGGLKAGDTLLSVTVDGREIPFAGGVDAAKIARAAHFGEPFKTKVLRRGPEGKERILQVTYPAIPATDRLPLLPRLAATAPDLLVFLACLAAALLIGMSRPEDEGAFAASLVFLCFSSFTWHGDMGLLPQPLKALGYSSWLALYACVTPALLWFCLRFPSPSPIDRRFPSLKRLAVAFGLIFAAWNGIIVWTQQVDQATYVQYLDGVRYFDWILDVVFCLLAVVGIAALFFKLRRAENQDERRRLTILLCGTLGLLPWLVGYLYSVTLAGPYPLAARLFVSLAMLIFPVSFIYAVLRHRVFGIRVILRRGLQFALLSRGFLAVEGVAIFVALYYAAGPVVGRIAGEDRGGVMAVTIAGLTLASIVGIRKVNGRVLVPIERRFFREAYDAREILTALTVRVRRLVGDPDALVTTAVETVASTLHPADASLFLRAETLLALPLAGERHALLRKTSADLAPGTFVSFWRSEATTSDPRRGDIPGPSRPLALPGDALVATLFADSTGALQSFSLDPKDRLSAAAQVARRGTPEERALLLNALLARLLVPLSVGTDLLGFFCLGEKLSEEPYSQEDVQLVSALAQQMADTLDHARLLHRSEQEEQLRREVQIAQQVQQNLLPQSPAPITGLDYAAVCRPARYVGGDYYDFIRRSPSSIGLALGDISGKGVSAALLMASLQATLREQAEAKGGQPGAIMAGVNRRLFESAGEGRFATLFYGVLDAEARVIDYANAGHNPAMLLRRSDQGIEVLRLPPTGTIVGAFPDQSYGQRRIALKAGDLLVIFSDGVTEARNEEGDFFEEERLRDLLSRLVGRSATEIRDRVLEEVSRFAGSAPQADDITLVVARLL